MDTLGLVTAFTTLFVVVDPLGLTPVFVALTRGMDPARRARVALRGCVIAAGLLTAFGLFGDKLLGAVGISMPAFRIAGGILLFLTALDMLFERRSRRRQDKSHDEDNAQDPSVFPLAMPLIAGPGALASMVLLTSTPGIDWLGIAGVLVVMLVVIAIVFLFFLAAGMLERALGDTGIMVVTRLLGMLLAALSVQFVIDGVRGAGLAPV